MNKLLTEILTNPNVRIVKNIKIAAEQQIFFDPWANGKEQ